MNGRQPRSLRFKIIILNCSIIFISMALLVSFLLFSMSSIIGSYLQEDINFFLEETGTNLETKTLFAEELLLEVRRNSILMTFLLNQAPATEETTQEFKKVANVYSDKNTDLVSAPFLTSAYLMNQGGSILSVHYHQLLFTQEQELSARILNLHTQFRGNGRDVQFFSDRDHIHVFFTIYTNFMQNIGTMAFSISTETLRQLMKPTERYQQTFWCLLNKYNEPLCRVEEHILEREDLPPLLEVTPEPRSLQLKGQTYRSYTHKLRLGLKVAMAIPENQMMTLIFQTIGSYLVYTVLLSLVIVGLSVLLILRLTVPLREIGEKITLVKEGQYDTKLPDYSSREFQEISSVFNQMTERINYLITEVYQKKLLLQDAELKFLQSQMNPHFMFNVLNMIAIKAQLDKNHDIHKMTTAFSRLVQASIYRKDTEKVSLRQELEYVEFYLYLQCYRHDGTLSYHINLQDESLLDCQVPKLCLQFIVENAVVHGLEPKSGGGHLQIDVHQQEQLLVLTVQDDGMGFETLEGTIPLPLQLPCHQESHAYKHNRVGLNNLHQLIQLLYGQEYGLRIFSQREQGTTVTITIPQEREEPCTRL